MRNPLTRWFRHHTMNSRINFVVAVICVSACLYLIPKGYAAARLPAEVAHLQNTNVSGFGSAVGTWADTLVIGAAFESSNARGVNNVGTNEMWASGAAYVFVRQGTNWVQQAYLKASNSELGDRFGQAVAIWGDTIAVGAPDEDSASGINGDQSNNGATNSGAVYIFVRQGTEWTQQAYLKTSNPGGASSGSYSGDFFGSALALSGDTLVVGAWGEDSGSTGVNGNQNDESAGGAGAAYVFVRNGTNWTQQAYLKASNTGAADQFGIGVAVSGDTIIVGAGSEDGGSPGVNGNPHDESAKDSGAAYVFVRTGTNWSQQAYLKASNPGGPDPGDSTVGDGFGWSVAISGDTIVVGAKGEDSRATGVNGDQSDNSMRYSGAAYVFVRSGTDWAQQAYLKASNTDAADLFGNAVAINGDVIAVSAEQEESSATGVNGNEADNSIDDAGAVYIFERHGTNWMQQAYVKPSTAQAEAYFGSALAMSGHSLFVSSGESSVYMFAPLGGQPRLHIEPAATAGRILRAATPPGARYHLETAQSVTGPWITNRTFISTGGWFEYHDTNAARGQLFYRLVHP